MQHLIRKEVHQLCSTKYGGSLLRGLSAESLTKFKWKSVTTEIKLRAPVLYKLVQAAITRQKKKPCLSDIGIAIAVILKHRNKFLAQAQGIVSALLYTGHSSKQVSSYKLICNITWSIACECFKVYIHYDGHLHAYNYCYTLYDFGMQECTNAEQILLINMINIIVMFY